MRVLVVGAGLAGVCTTHHLIQNGIDVELIDNGVNVSTAVAAGIINPIVFRRTTLSWRLAELLEYGYPFYQSIELKTNSSFFRLVPIRRLFAHEQERETWLKKQTQEGYNQFLKPISEEDDHFELEQNTFGTGVVLNTASINSMAFLEANYHYFDGLNLRRKESFDYQALDPVTGVYKNEAYDFIIFCEGKDAKHNPYFSHLPLSQTKGEVLDIELTLSTSESLNRKCFLMPQEDGTFKTGSTYIWKTDDSIPTEEGKNEILKNLQSITSETAKVVGHRAGVRPTVIDRRPILGKHPEFPKLAILNGLGTKGYMIAPLISKELVEHLIEGKDVHPETTILRFQE